MEQNWWTHIFCHCPYVGSFGDKVGHLMSRILGFGFDVL